MILLTHSEWAELIKPFNNRKLLRSYRESIQLRADIKPHAARYGLYLGDSAHLQLLDIDRGIEQHEKLLRERGYNINIIIKTIK